MAASRGCGQRGDNGWGECGGYMAAKKRKLEEQFDKDRVTNVKQQERKSNIFHGISIFVDGHTEPPADELKKLMMEHGGVYHAYYSKDKVTYFISNNLPYAKIRKLKPNDKVVRSQWIVDCITQGKLLPTNDYEMYKDVTRSRGQTELKFKRVEPSKTGENFSANPSEPSTTVKAEFNVPDSDEETEELVSNGIRPLERTPSPSRPEQQREEEEADENDDDRLAALNAKHPKFLETFLKRSRLHYLSATAVAKKVYVHELREKREHRLEIERRREQLIAKLNNNSMRTDLDRSFKLFDEKNDRIYMHIDMDCFFVSVATRNQPELRDQPIAITHSKGTKSTTTNDHQFYSRSEIASCNYAARQFGVRNGMYLGKAQELCNQHRAKLLCLSYDYNGFHEVSRLFYDIILGYTLDVEAVSCDELFVDLTDLLIALKPLHPLSFVSLLRDEIQTVTRCPCSAGLGANMLLARLATRQAKPNGQYYVEQGSERNFMAKQKLCDLPGIGPAQIEKLQQISHDHMETCEQVQNFFSLDQLKNVLGKKQGQTMYDACRGQDSRVLSKDYTPKSISIDVNYGIRFQNYDDLTPFVKQLATELHKRLQQAKQKGKQLTVKIRVRRADAPIEPDKFMGCGRTDDFSRLTNLILYTDDPITIELETIKLLKQLNFVVADLRGIGITMTHFQAAAAGTMTKSTRNGVPTGNRTLFECRQFRVPQPPAIENDDSIDDNEPSESTTRRKRPMQQDQSAVIEKKLPRHDCYTPGQIDRRIMDELPTPIRQEVEEHLRHPPAILQLIDRNQIDIIEKSFTQVMDHIDESVLNELPPEVRREIINAQKMRKIESKYPPVGGKRIVPVAAPVPAATTTTTTKANAFNVLMNSPQKQPPPSKKTSNPIKKWRTETILGEVPIISRVNDEQQQNNNIIQKQNQPSIAGCSSLVDVKLMLREWIQSTEEPSQIDLDLFQTYLLELLGIFNAEMVHNVLVYGLLQMKTSSTNPSKWNVYFENIIDHVQTRFRQMYGAQMDLSY